MIRRNELMNVRCSERGSLLGIKIYSPSSECLIECVDIPEQCQKNFWEYWNFREELTLHILFKNKRVIIPRVHETRAYCQSLFKSSGN